MSSETREYIPICVLDENVIGSNKLLILPKPELWIMAVLTSAMHMGWMRTVAGRLESRYSYAPNVYNSFPWPVVDDADKAKLEASAKAIVAAREACAPATLEDMYDAGGMPVEVRQAHKANDRLVDRLYRKESFATERERVEHLFNLFQTRSAPLVAASGKQKRKSAKKS